MPLQSSSRVTFAAPPAGGSEMSRWNRPEVKAASGALASSRRSRLFGVITTSGLRHGRITWRRSRWKTCALLVG